MAKSHKMLKVLKFTSILLVTFLQFWWVPAHANQCHQLFKKNTRARLADKALAVFSAARRFLGKSIEPEPSHLEYGWKVLARDHSGKPLKVRVRILVDNPSLIGKVKIIGSFNDWGKNLRPEDIMTPVEGKPHIFETTLTGFENGTQYLIDVDGKKLLDPTAVMYTARPEGDAAERPEESEYLNSVFWDVYWDVKERAPKKNRRFVNLGKRYGEIWEVDIGSLAKSFPSDGSKGPARLSNTFRYIANSDIPKLMRKMGVTGVELMPLLQSDDGGSWQFRYLGYGIFAIDSRFGSPDDFTAMVKAFHGEGISVIMDVVPSHFQPKGNLGNRSIETKGLANWQKGDGRPLFSGSMSPWGTPRPDFLNPYLRKLWIDGAVSLMDAYGIDGFRFDNGDGVAETPGGRQLISEFGHAVRARNPNALIINEAFKWDSKLLLQKELGGSEFTTRNDQDAFNFLKDWFGGATETIHLWKFAEYLKNAWIGGEIPLMRFFTNHDWASQNIGGATGAYPASLIDKYYAFKKYLAMDSLMRVISAYHLTIPQALLMQEGSFTDNPAVDWSRRQSGLGKQLWDYFGAMGRYMVAHSDYFNFASLNSDLIHHVDDNNKIISIQRRNPNTNRSIYIIINLGHHRIENYRIGVDDGTPLRVGLSSEFSEFGGAQEIQRDQHFATENVATHGKSTSFNLNVVAPYSVTILEPAPAN